MQQTIDTAIDVLDHSAERIEAMQLELDHRASVSQTWFDRFQTAEASLAACRALVADWRDTGSYFGHPADVRDAYRECANELEAATINSPSG
jgi:hypothetical protein